MPRRIRALRVARQHVVHRRRVIAALTVNDRLDETNLVHHLGHARQMLANLRAGDIAGDRRELAAILDRSVRLHIQRVDVAHSARREQQNAVHLFRVRASFCCRFCSQQARQIQAEQA